MSQIPPEPEVSVPELLRQRAKRDPDGVLIQEATGSTISNAGFHAAAMGVANALTALGVKPGGCVVTLATRYSARWPRCASRWWRL